VVRSWSLTYVVALVACAASSNRPVKQAAPAPPQSPPAPAPVPPAVAATAERPPLTESLNDVELALRMHEAAVLSCLPEQALDPRVAQPVVADLHVDLAQPAGTRPAGLGEASPVEVCLEREMRTWRLSAPTDQHTLRAVVRLPLSLAAAEGAPGVHLTPPEVASVIRDHLAVMKRCYEDVLQREPDERGRVVLHWILGADGQAEVVRVEEATVHDERLPYCLAHRILELRFPPFDPDDGPAEISFPFAFTSKSLTRASSGPFRAPFRSGSRASVGCG
jgi:hypothetical protein